MRFFAHESCGKCTPCREGGTWLERILQRIVDGHGRPRTSTCCSRSARRSARRLPARGQRAARPRRRAVPVKMTTICFVGPSAYVAGALGAHAVPRRVRGQDRAAQRRSRSRRAPVHDEPREPTASATRRRRADPNDGRPSPINGRDGRRRTQGRAGHRRRASAHGDYIPRFCYHERMKPVGMCRMCLVEVDTGRGPALQPSCMITGRRRHGRSTPSRRRRRRRRTACSSCCSPTTRSTARCATRAASARCRTRRSATARARAATSRRSATSRSRSRSATSCCSTASAASCATAAPASPTRSPATR